MLLSCVEACLPGTCGNDEAEATGPLPVRKGGGLGAVLLCLKAGRLGFNESEKAGDIHQTYSSGR